MKTKWIIGVLLLAALLSGVSGCVYERRPRDVVVVGDAPPPVYYEPDPGPPVVYEPEPEVVYYYDGYGRRYYYDHGAARYGYAPRGFHPDDRRPAPRPAPHGAPAGRDDRQPSNEAFPENKGY